MENGTRLMGVRVAFASMEANNGGFKTFWSDGSERHASLEGLQEAGRGLVTLFVAAKGKSEAGQWAPGTWNTVLKGGSGTPARQVQTLHMRLTTGLGGGKAPRWLEDLFPAAAARHGPFLSLVQGAESKVEKLFTADYNANFVPASRLSVSVGSAEVTDPGHLFRLILGLSGLSAEQIQSVRQSGQPKLNGGALAIDMLQFLFLTSLEFFGSRIPAQGSLPGFLSETTGTLTAREPEGHYEGAFPIPRAAHEAGSLAAADAGVAEVVRWLQGEGRRRGW